VSESAGEGARRAIYGITAAAAVRERETQRAAKTRRRGQRRRTMKSADGMPRGLFGLTSDFFATAAMMFAVCGTGLLF
jgi:hypothetical protein